VVGWMAREAGHTVGWVGLQAERVTEISTEGSQHCTQPTQMGYGVSLPVFWLALPFQLFPCIRLCSLQVREPGGCQAAADNHQRACLRQPNGRQPSSLVRRQRGGWWAGGPVGLASWWCMRYVELFELRAQAPTWQQTVASCLVFPTREQAAELLTGSAHLCLLMS